LENYFWDRNGSWFSVSHKHHEMARRRICLVSDKLTKLPLIRIGGCGIAVFAPLLTTVFFTFGSPLQSTELSSIVLAGDARLSVLDTETWLLVDPERALAPAAKFSPTLEQR